VKLFSLCFLLFFIFCFSIPAQEPENEPELIPEIDGFTGYSPQEQEEDDSIFVITSFIYNVTGRTRPYMLNKKAEFKIGEEIRGRKNFEKFIREKRQLLINERVLKDNVVVEYSITEINEEGKFPVEIEILTEDTRNIIAFPQPSYNSNYGLELALKARDYNFLGTMNPLKIDLSYKFNQYGETKFSLLVDAGVPFEALNLDWFVDFDNYFDYSSDLSHPFFYKNRTSLSLDIPVKRATFNVWFAESIVLNEENEKSDWPLYGDVQAGLYMVSNPGISWLVPTGLLAGNFGELEYKPSIHAEFYHEFSKWPLSENRVGPFFTFYHYLGFERIDWKNNLREGLSVYADNSYRFDVHYQKKNDKVNYYPWEIYYSVNATGHFIFVDDWIGLSARLYHRHWIKTYYEYAGDVVRGVYDNVSDPKYGKDAKIEMMLCANLDFQFKAIRFLPSKWFPKLRFMRVFDFDMLINPFIDAAWYKPLDQKASADSKFFFLGSGIEFIIFPHRFRSLFFRVSTAWDFSDIPRKVPNFVKDLELNLEMGFHY